MSISFYSFIKSFCLFIVTCKLNCLFRACANIDACSFNSRSHAPLGVINVRSNAQPYNYLWFFSGCAIESWDLCGANKSRARTHQSVFAASLLLRCALTASLFAIRPGREIRIDCFMASNLLTAASWPPRLIGRHKIYYERYLREDIIIKSISRKVGRFPSR
jgi:hypothetical protein